jgi:hypothetical protein
MIDNRNAMPIGEQQTNVVQWVARASQTGEKIEPGPNRRRSSSMLEEKISERESAMQKICNELRSVTNDGKIGDIVAKHAELILQYYQDVREQAERSFFVAQIAAAIGFAVFIITWLYVLISNHSWTMGILGSITGLLIELMAGIGFWLYAQSARQFSAFHICLERTNRYLIAYKMADEMKAEKDGTLRELVCIMATAPMIGDFDLSVRKSFTKGETGTKVRRSQRSSRTQKDRSPG